MAAGEQFDLQEMISFRVGDVPVAQLRKFGPGPRFAGYEALVEALVAFHPVFQQAFRLLRRRAAQRQVGLVHLRVPEHRIQPIQCLGGFCEDAKAAHRTVQAVGDSHEDLPRLGVAHRDKRLEGFAEGLVPGLVSLHYFSRLLVEYKQVVVFVYDAGREIVIFRLVQSAIFHSCGKDNDNLSEISRWHSFRYMEKRRRKVI